MRATSNIFKQGGHLLQAYMLDIFARATKSMSLRNKKKLAWLLSGFTFNCLKLRKKFVISSIQRHLEMDHQQASSLARQVYYNFLLNAFEMAALKFLSDRELSDKISCEGLQHLDQALSQKRGVIIISGHFGLWEFVPPWLALNGYQTTVVVRRQNNPHVDHWMEKMRQKHGARTTDSGYGMREILKSLRRGHILALMVDQDNGKQGIFARFFNAWASAPTGPALISLKTGAPIVPLAIFPGYGKKHKIQIFAPIDPNSFTKDIAGQLKMTQAYTSLLEQIVRQSPQQWFWLHRRWKTSLEDARHNEWVKFLKTTLTDESIPS
jgi:KDO2-lipid IV(A) lauroyltransferase